MGSFDEGAVLSLAGSHRGHNVGDIVGVLTSSLGPRPTCATCLKMSCSASRLNRASFVPKIRTRTNCTGKARCWGINYVV